jgi:hypothetical protein
LKHIGPRSPFSVINLLASQLSLTEIGRTAQFVGWQPFSDFYQLLYCFALEIRLVLFGEISEVLISGGE